jgi:hypothetical protein
MLKRLEWQCGVGGDGDGGSIASKWGASIVDIYSKEYVVFHTMENVRKLWLIT